MTTEADVLVVGAGPTGLTLALQAVDHGATVRIVDRRTTAFRPSRAMILHAHTMESLRRLGVAEEILDRADSTPRAVLHLGRREVGVRLGDVPWEATPFPHLTLVRQTDVETVLVNALRERGVEVDQGVELVTASSDDESAHAVLRVDGTFVDETYRFVAGCDGPASAVRRAAAIGWRGRPYQQEVVLADVELDGGLEPGMLHAVPARTGLVFMFALGEGAKWRLLATRPATGAGAPFGQTGDPLTAEDVRRILAASGLDARLTELRWSARVRLQHRLADSFRRGRLFLAGDAAHTHSPAAAQGMNTGILDAVNLGWKLAFAAGGEDRSSLLDSYELERRPVARRVLALTHVVFFGEASTHPLPALLRGTLLPRAAPLLPAVVAQRRLMALVLRLLAQDWATYRRSPLSESGVATGRLRPGDRVPDQVVEHDGRRVRLHELTAGPGIHVLLDRDAVALDAVGPWVEVHRISSWPGRGIVAVRPDGYVGFASGRVEPARLAAWLDVVQPRRTHDRARGPA